MKRNRMIKGLIIVAYKWGYFVGRRQTRARLRHFGNGWRN